MLPVDILSDVLRAVRLTGAFFYLVEASPPWSVSAVAARELKPRVLPESGHLIAYHILTQGQCWGGVCGQPQQRMAPGDVIVFPHGHAHFMSSERDRQIGADEVAAAPDRYPGTVYLGPEAPRNTHFVCGFLGCDARPFNPLLSALPDVLFVPGVASGWLEAFPRQVVAESRRGRVGAETMLTRMAELMFIEVLRHHFEHTSRQQTGWLAGLRDPVIAPALSLLHARPAQAWTIADLAAEAAVSRSVLAERFTTVIGMPPIQYLTQWRLQLAADLMARGCAKIASVAQQVGYDSEAAFSRAFKRATGSSPSEWRERRRAD